MVIFEYGHNTKPNGVSIKCVHCKRWVHWNINNKWGKDVIPIFLKYVVFKNVCLSWLIQIREIEYDVEVVCPRWSEYGHYCNTKICLSLHVVSFDLFL